MANDMAPPVAIPTYGYEVVNAFPHARDAFTQGLQYVDGRLYEGTGQYGQSSLRCVELETGRVLQRRALDRRFFGEGIAVVGERIFQLTWENELGFVYDRASFEPLGTFTYAGEGWGLAHLDGELVMSDGTPTLRFLDPGGCAERRRLTVTANGRPLPQLNALAVVGPELFANVWMTDFIARIDPESGHVVGWIDLRGLLRPWERVRADVLNGIAWDATGRRLFVTGKYWPRLFEIRLVPRAAE